VCVYYW